MIWEIKERAKFLRVGPASIAKRRRSAAYLISAAPEMFEALERIKDLLDDGENAHQTIENIIDHALARARGEK